MADIVCLYADLRQGAASCLDDGVRLERNVNLDSIETIDDNNVYHQQQAITKLLLLGVSNVRNDQAQT